MADIGDRISRLEDIAGETLEGATLGLLLECPMDYVCLRPGKAALQYSMGMIMEQDDKVYIIYHKIQIPPPPPDELKEADYNG